MKSNAILGAFLAASFVVQVPMILSSPVAAQTVREDGALPGYYEFYMKKGKLERLGAEQQRDQKIESGSLAPEVRDTPMPALALPQQSGKPLDFHSYRGDKNILIATYRAWW